MTMSDLPEYRIHAFHEQSVEVVRYTQACRCVLTRADTLAGAVFKVRRIRRQGMIRTFAALSALGIPHNPVST